MNLFWSLYKCINICIVQLYLYSYLCCICVCVCKLQNPSSAWYSWLLPTVCQNLNALIFVSFNCICICICTCICVCISKFQDTNHRGCRPEGVITSFSPSVQIPMQCVFVFMCIQKGLFVFPTLIQIAKAKPFFQIPMQFAFVFINTWTFYFWFQKF